MCCSLEMLSRMIRHKPVKVLAALRAIGEKLLTQLQISDSKINHEETLLLLAHFCSTVPLVAKPHLASMMTLVLPRIMMNQSPMLASALLCFGRLSLVHFAFDFVPCRLPVLETAASYINSLDIFQTAPQLFCWLFQHLVFLICIALS
jgi:hypothetical protein